jgi:formate dehydrogenase major subunit/formate dehydrogenase beta subunit
VVDKKKCNGCWACALFCPLDFICMVDGVAEMACPDECWHCGACRQARARYANPFRFPVDRLAT